MSDNRERPCLHCAILACIKQFALANSKTQKLPPTEIIVHASKVVADMVAVYFTMDPVTPLAERNEFMDVLLEQTRKRIETQFLRALHRGTDSAHDIEH